MYDSDVAKYLAKMVGYDVTLPVRPNSVVAKLLVELMEHLESIGNLGRYLSIWDCTTGLPKTNPTALPYTYKTGDYYLIGKVGTTNYMPDGTSYTGEASTTVDSNSPAVLDMYRFDGITWTLLRLGEQLREILANYYTKTESDNKFAAKEDVVEPQIVVCYDQSGVAHTYEINMQEVNV